MRENFFTFPECLAREVTNGGTRILNLYFVTRICICPCI